MPKITIVGAGGFVFPLTMIRDVLAFPELQESTFCLMDVDASNLARTVGYAERLISSHNLPTKLMSTTDRRAALEDADFVIVTFQVGGLEAYRSDVEIPRNTALTNASGHTRSGGSVQGASIDGRSR